MMTFSKCNKCKTDIWANIPKDFPYPPICEKCIGTVKAVHSGKKVKVSLYTPWHRVK